MICLYTGEFSSSYNITLSRDLKTLKIAENATKLEPEVEREFWEFLDKEFLIMSLYSKDLNII